MSDPSGFMQHSSTRVKRRGSEPELSEPELGHGAPPQKKRKPQAPKAKGRKWTAEQAARLGEVVIRQMKLKLAGGRPKSCFWHVVAGSMGGGHTARQCQEKWRNGVDPTRSKGRCTLCMHACIFPHTHIHHYFTLWTLTFSTS